MWKSPRYDEVMGKQALPATEAATVEPPKEQGEKLASFPRTNRDGAEEELRLVLDQFNGNDFISLRVWTQDRTSGAWWPSKRGCSIRLGEIDGIRDGLAQAQRLADKRRPPPARATVGVKGRATARVQEQRPSNAGRVEGREFDEFGPGE